MKPTTGEGWCGLFNDGSLGWLLSRFVSRGHGNAASLDEEQRRALTLTGDYRFEPDMPNDFYRVRITITPIKNKRGHYIVRRGKRVPS